jgi:hypothetical protein
MHDQAQRNDPKPCIPIDLESRPINSSLISDMPQASKSCYSNRMQWSNMLVSPSNASIVKVGNGTITTTSKTLTISSCATITVRFNNSPPSPVQYKTIPKLNPQIAH